MAKKLLSTTYVIKHAEELFHSIRWEGGIVVCPYCGSIHVYSTTDQYHYRCRDCKRKFSDRTQSLFHGCRLPMSVCMQAIHEMTVDNYVSAGVLSVKLGIDRKSAWLLQLKLRRCMEQDRWLLEGIIAQDECYIGGSLSNFHYARKWDLLNEKGIIQIPNPHGAYDENGNKIRFTKSEVYQLSEQIKQPVYGLNDGKKIVLMATPNPIKKEYLRYIYKKHVVGDSVTVSDESSLYEGWTKATGAKLHTNNHHNNQYVTEHSLSSNRIENTFSWLKRGFVGRITHCKYHQLYLNEFVFRYNTRDMTTYDRFKTLVQSTIGKHYTYKDIRNYDPYADFPKPKIRRKGKLTLDEIRETLMDGWVSVLEQDGRLYTRKDFNL